MASSVTIHMLNLLIAIFMSTDNDSDQCVWYFVNLFIDTTLGVFICFAMILCVDKIARDNNIQNLKTGLYFEKIEKGGAMITKMKPKMYFIQLGIWLLIVVIVFIYFNFLGKIIFTWIYKNIFNVFRINRKLYFKTIQN